MSHAKQKGIKESRDGTSPPRFLLLHHLGIQSRALELLALAVTRLTQLNPSHSLTFIFKP